MSDTQRDEKQEVIIVDIKMPFMSMVNFWSNWQLHQSPPLLYCLFFMVFGVLFDGIFYGLGMGMVSVWVWDVINFDQHYCTEQCEQTDVLLL